jgi:hypothetical protein
LEIVGRWRVSEESEQSGLEEEELVVLQMAGELAADEWQKAVAFVVEDDILKDDILFQRNCGDSYGDGSGMVEENMAEDDMVVEKWKHARCTRRIRRVDNY